MKQVEEIIAEQGFIDWANGVPSKQADDWQQWMQQNPHQQTLVNEALNFVRLLQVKEVTLSQAEIALEKNRLLTSINEAAKVVPLRKNVKWWLSAAACMLLVVASYGIYQLVFAKHEKTTAYGQIAKQQLPDGSIVLLNSNTIIKYEKKWDNTHPREVWITGEAFFEVQKTANKQPFIVHANNFDVVVTGTKFNVVNRPNSANVLLKEGSVTLQAAGSKTLQLLPGEYVNVQNAVQHNAPLAKELAKEEATLAWVNKKLYFENANVTLVAQKIKELYGLEVVIASNEVAAKTVSGILPNDSLDVLLQALEATAEFKISKKANSIYIEMPN